MRGKTRPKKKNQGKAQYNAQYLYYMYIRKAVLKFCITFICFDVPLHCSAVQRVCHSFGTVLKTVIKTSSC